MKKTINSILLLSSLCAATGTYAQDKYIALGHDRVIQTTNTSGATTYPFALPYYGIRPRFVFDASGTYLFTYDHTAVEFSGNIISGNNVNFGAEAVVPIPDACRQYILLSVDPGPGNTSCFSMKVLDANGVTQDPNNTAIPSIISAANLVCPASPQYYGVVVAPMNANREHYVYFMNNYSGVGTCFLSRYTVSSTGVVSSPVVFPNAQLPYINGGARSMKISQDGNTIAYQAANGNMVTFNVSNINNSTYTQYPSGTYYGLEQVTYNGERRWYVSTATAFGYYVEGNTTFNTVSTTIGYKTELALNPYGYITMGALIPGTTFGSTGMFKVYIIGSNTFTGRLGLGFTDMVYCNGTQYILGNNIAGENTAQQYMTGCKPAPLGIGEETAPENTGTVSVAPNPASDKITLNFTGVDGKNISADLYDMQGRKLMSLVPQTKAAGGKRTFEADVQNLPSGMYLYRYSINGEVKTDKLTIAH